MADTLTDEVTSRTRSLNRYNSQSRTWVNEAIRKLHADATRSADTHLFLFPLPVSWGIDLYLKDESVHPTGSLKHRLARSLFLHALCSGWITEKTPIFEASSGSTAVSEAYFAHLLGLTFTAVVPSSTSQEKVKLIQLYGGTVRPIDDPTKIEKEAADLAAKEKGHFMDQFTYAERAYDYRDDHNLAATIFAQMAEERHREPSWIVTGAGTGGSCTTIGRYLRYTRRTTGLCVVDPEHSAFFPGWERNDPTYTTGHGSLIEGIGRPTVEPSFLPKVIDRMISVPDAASVAAMRFLYETTGHRAGPSTGTNLWGALYIVAEMLLAGEQGSVAALLCDVGERYAETYYSDDWVHSKKLNLGPYTSTLRHLMRTGAWKADPEAPYSSPPPLAYVDGP